MPASGLSGEGKLSLVAGVGVAVGVGVVAGAGVAAGVELSCLELSAGESDLAPVAGTTGTAKGLGTSITFVAPGTRTGVGTLTTFGGAAGAVFSIVRSIILVSF